MTEKGVTYRLDDESNQTFSRTLEQHGMTLQRGVATTLQINTGSRCDLACRHCHLEAGPDRQEIMSRETMSAVVAFAERNRFAYIDVTGGAPELVPEMEYLLENLARLPAKLLFRTNLTALHDHGRDRLVPFLAAHETTIIASLPATNAAQTEAQRGPGVWDKCLAMLRHLNCKGYGVGSGPALHLVANPTGAFLPPGQCQAEDKFRRDLKRHDIAFTSLYTFANAPLGRFRTWLESSGNLTGYLDRLRGSFNPAAVTGLMCRSMISVNWKGYLYDCDFNLATDQPLGGEHRHVTETRDAPPAGLPIAVGEHCFACTAGTGFT